MHVRQGGSLARATYVDPRHRMDRGEGTMLKRRVAALVAGAAIFATACSSGGGAAGTSAPSTGAGTGASAAASGGTAASAGASAAAGGSAAATACHVGVSWPTFQEERYGLRDEPSI